MDNFIQRKFKNIETNEIVKFEFIINRIWREEKPREYCLIKKVDLSFWINLLKQSNISIILGEPASGKTYQLKEYAEKDFSYFVELINIEDEDDIEDEVSLILLDSIDEALIDYKNPKKLQSKLSKFIKNNSDKKIVITCRYLEWKKYFEENLKKLDKELKVYKIIPLTKEEIDNLLKDEDKEDFWNFIDNNHLESLLKNIMIIFHLVKKFRSYNIDSNYVDIYEKIVKEYITKIGEDRKEQDTDKDLDKSVLVASSLATYMTLNRLPSISSLDLKKVASECYKIDGKAVVADDLTAILKTALFEKKENDFRFFHKSIQEYLTAYFINCKKLDSKTIKKVFSHDLKFCEEFEEVIIYLTNMQPQLFDEFVDFDPFIFRRHPSLTKKRQEKLLLSIIVKFQNNEAYTWNRESFFYSTSLVKFDKINVYSIIKDKNIENIEDDTFLLYIMRLFAENSANYSKEFENYVFSILDENVRNKRNCRKPIKDSYTENNEYNVRLFKFIKKHELFSTSSHELYWDEIIEKIFLWLLKEPEKNKGEIFNFLPYVKYDLFIREMTDFKLKDIVRCIIEGKIKCKIEGCSPNRGVPGIYTPGAACYMSNIGRMFYSFLEEGSLKKVSLEKDLLFDIIFYKNEHKISISPYISEKNKKVPSPLSFDIISDNFWEIYFSDKIKEISEVEKFLDIYTIQKNDINKIMQEKYPFEDNFMKTMELLKYLNRKKRKNSGFYEEEVDEIVDEEKIDKIVSELEKIENIEKNTDMCSNIFILFKYNYSKKLEDLVFKLLSRDEYKGRGYISLSHNKKYDYNVRLFDFMKKNSRLYKGIDTGDEETLDFSPIIDYKIERDLFINQIANEDIKFDKLNELLTVEYIHSFLNVYNDVLIPTIRLNEIIETYKESDNSYYKKNIAWVIYLILKKNQVEENLMEKINSFVKNNDIPIADFFKKEEDKKLDFYLRYIDDGEISKEDKEEKEEEEEVKYRKWINENSLKENWFKMYSYALKKVKKTNLRASNAMVLKTEIYPELNQKLKEDLKEEYENFIEIVKCNYNNIEKKGVSLYKKGNVFNFLFSTLSFDEIEKFIVKKDDKKKFFNLVLRKAIFKYKPIEEYIKSEFDIFLDVLINYIRFVVELPNNISFVNEITLIREKEYTNDRLDELYQFIKNKMISSDNPFYYWDYMQEIDSNKAIDDFYSCIYNPNPLTVLFDDFIKKLKYPGNEEQIERIIIDYYKLNNTNDSSNIWRFLESHENYKKLLKRLKESKNKNIANLATFSLIKNYDNQCKERSFRNEYYKDIFDKDYETVEKESLERPLIITEGKTDWKHLKKALERFQSEEFNLYLDLDIEFEEYHDIGAGESTIDSWLKSTAKLKQEQRHIFMFDRDTSKYVQEYGEKEFIRVIDKDYLNRLKEKLEKYYGDKSSKKYLTIVQNLDNGSYQEVDEEIKKALIGNEYDEWKKLSNNQVYALCIPEIKDSDSPRTLDKICIEFYYKEKDLKTTKDEKRLFFADEFELNKENNGDNSKRFISKCGKFKTSSRQVKDGATAELTLISSEVYSIDDEQSKDNLLLSKNDFTKYIENEVEGFDDFDIENFRLIFDVIKKIVKD